MSGRTIVVLLCADCRDRRPGRELGVVGKVVDGQPPVLVYKSPPDFGRKERVAAAKQADPTRRVKAPRTPDVRVAIDGPTAPLAPPNGDNDSPLGLHCERHPGPRAITFGELRAAVAEYRRDGRKAVTRFVSRAGIA
jgi:hypothetical protein